MDLEENDRANSVNDELDTYFNNQEHHADQFNTSACGVVDGKALAARLSEAAVAHAITLVDLYSPAKEAAHLFTLDHRYGANRFQGIMPDTGAAGVSTAGEMQVEALQNVQNVQNVAIDKTTAGKHRIRFGDNPECASLGDVEVQTPFGLVKFAVMPTNTPFLLCLADMDTLGVYLNNVEDVLVHKDKEYPVVRKWGHPWLLLDENTQETAACHLTEQELTQIHRRFGHPAANRLHTILSKAGYDY